MMNFMIPPSTAQIDEQVKLEREAIKQGLKRLQDQTIKLEDQDYASASIYAIASIEKGVKFLRVHDIKETKQALTLLNKNNYS